MMLCTIIAPELVLAWVVRQMSSARMVEIEFKGTHYSFFRTKTHLICRSGLDRNSWAFIDYGRVYAH